MDGLGGGGGAIGTNLLRENENVGPSRSYFSYELYWAMDGTENQLEGNGCYITPMLRVSTLDILRTMFGRFGFIKKEDKVEFGKASSRELIMVHNKGLSLTAMTSSHMSSRWQSMEV